MTTILVITPWIGSGKTMQDARRPQVIDDYPGIKQWEDVTGQAGPSKHNEYTVRAVCDDETVQAIAANSAYQVLIEDRVSGAESKAVVRRALEAKGVMRAQARHLAGESEDVTDAEIARRRIEWQRTLPNERSA